MPSFQIRALSNRNSVVDSENIDFQEVTTLQSEFDFKILCFYVTTPGLVEISQPIEYQLFLIDQ